MYYTCIVVTSQRQDCICLLQGSCGPGSGMQRKLLMFSTTNVYIRAEKGGVSECGLLSRVNSSCAATTMCKFLDEMLVYVYTSLPGVENKLITV